jgi:hypothetical protein
MWDWLQNLSGGAASFVGSFTGAAIGLVALLIGALFNARLNRRRDDALRKLDARSVAAALRAELSGLNRTLLHDAERLATPPEWGTYTPDLAHSVRVMPHMLPKLGLLDADTIQDVIDAYSLVEQYCELSLSLGARLEENLAPLDGLMLGLQLRQSTAELLILCPQTPNLANQLANHPNQARLRQTFERIRDASCHP